MRPLGDISAAILAAAARLVREEGGVRRGPTVRELAAAACVGQAAARIAVGNLARRGHLQRLACDRRVAYRNRPVCEYAPAEATPVDDGEGFAAVGAVLTGWKPIAQEVSS